MTMNKKIDTYLDIERRRHSDSVFISAREKTIAINQKEIWHSWRVLDENLRRRAAIVAKTGKPCKYSPAAINFHYNRAMNYGDTTRKMQALNDITKSDLLIARFRVPVDIFTHMGAGMSYEDKRAAIREAANLLTDAELDRLYLSNLFDAVTGDDYV